MMKVSHSLCGLSFGTLVSGALSYPELHVPLPVRLLMIPLFGGAAIAPDSDHTQATIAHTLGPISKGACWAVNEVSLTVYNATRSPKDKPKNDGHRTLTHTGLGCVMFGAEQAVVDRVSAWLTPITAPHWVSVLPPALQLAFWMSLMLYWAKKIRRGAMPAARWMKNNFLGRTLGDLLIFCVRHIPEAYALVSTVGTVMVMATYPEWWWIWPIVITVGSMVHIAGDACTNSGVPHLLSPLISIDGQRWARVRTPITFKTGQSTEKTLITPGLIALTLIAMVLVSGLTPISHYVFPWM